MTTIVCHHALGHRLAAKTTLVLATALVGVPNPAAPQSPQVGVHPRPLVRLDGSHENFSRFDLLSASRTGILAVAQQQDGQIRLYSAAGGLIAKVGRPGEGPGEFRGINAIGWKGDTAWIADYRVGRLTLVGPDGRIVRSIPLPTSATQDRLPAAARGFRWTPRVAAVFADGAILYSLRRLVDGPGGRSAAVREIEGWLIRGTVEGVLTTPTLQLPRSGCDLRADGAVMAQVQLHLCPEPLSALSPDGSSIAVVTMSAPTRRSAEYTLTLHTADGTRTAARSMQVPSRQVPGPIRDTMIADYQNAIPAVRELTRGYRIPEFYPPVTRLHVGPGGDVWVTVRNPDGSRRWQVFDRTARHLGDVPVPEGGSVAAVDRRGIWTNVVDAEGLEHLVLLARPGS